MTHGRAAASMVLVTLLWSSAGVVARQLHAAQPFELNFWRSLFTAVALGLMLAWLRGVGPLLRTLAGGGRVLWGSALCWSVMFTAFMVAVAMTTVANVLVTMALGPLFTALVARAVLKVKLPARTWIAIAVAGITASRSTVETAIGRACAPPAGRRRPEPTHSRPIGSAAWPRMLSVDAAMPSTAAGRPAPSTGAVGSRRRFRPSPIRQDTTSGFVAIAFSTPTPRISACPWRARTNVDSTLTMGTITALAKAASATPCCPNRVEAITRPT